MNPFEEYVKTLESAHMEVEFFKFQKAFHTHPRIIILGNGCLLYTSDAADE